MLPAEQFPLFKLVTLIARQLSSPIASRIKIYAKEHPRFSESVCMRTGRVFRNAELRFRMWTLQLRRPDAMPPLSQREALDAGADILGECVIFILGVLIILFEFNRQAMKQEVKELEIKSQWLAVELSLQELRHELELQQTQIDEMYEAVLKLQQSNNSLTPSRDSPHR